MIKKFSVGEYQANCYIYCKDKATILIDPGAEGKKIKKYILENELSVKAILLTHGHIDHIGATNYLYDFFKCPIYIHMEDLIYLSIPNYNLSNDYTIKTDDVSIFTDELLIDDFSFKIHHLPGHTPGSCMIESGDENILFSGDILFKGSIGRYDLPLGSHHDTKKTIEMIKSKFDKDYVIYPGHGDRTTLQEELNHNPYFNC